MFTNLFSPQFFVINGITLLVLITAFRKPELSRLWLALILASAAVVNGVLAFRAPQSYLAFANVAVFEWYADYITGPFRDNITLVVMTIAVLQLLTAFGMLHRGLPGKAAFTGAILFFLAIAPLGAGSAFPAPVFLGAACLVILLKWKKSGVKIAGTAQQGSHLY